MTRSTRRPDLVVGDVDVAAAGQPLRTSGEFRGLVGHPEKDETWVGPEDPMRTIVFDNDVVNESRSRHTACRPEAPGFCNCGTSAHPDLPRRACGDLLTSTCPAPRQVLSGQQVPAAPQPLGSTRRETKVSFATRPLKSTT